LRRACAWIRAANRRVQFGVELGDALSGVRAYDVEHLVLGDQYVRVRQRLDGAQSQ
jgi:hypothetical protein